MADDLKRCLLCNGTKRVRGLGMIEKECIECHGIGWVSKNPVDVKVKKRKKINKEEKTKNEAVHSL